MKKVLLCSLCLLVCALGINIPAVAQPSQKLVNVVVSPDRPDWKYKVGDEAVFTVQVLEAANPVKGITVDYEVGPEFFPTVKKEGVVLKDGKMTLKAKMTEPGFARCRVVAKKDGYTYEGLATVAFSEDQIRPTSPEPVDFDAFWTDALAQARKTPLDPIVTLLPERCTPTQNVYQVSFQNERPGSRIYGILMMPKKEGKYPAVLWVPGAGVRGRQGFNLGDSIITLQIGIHGVPVDMPDGVYRDLGSAALSGYWRYSMNDRDEHYYKRVYTGCVRAVDFLCSLPEFDGKTIGVTGGSQGGALSIVTTALDPRIRFMALNHPALCDFAGYLNHRAGGWPHYFREKQPKPGEVEALSYYDVVNFAKRVKVPGWFTWGYNDVVCPPTSMYAAYNVIPAPKELHLYLDSGHWIYPEQAKASNKWLKEHCGIR